MSPVIKILSAALILLSCNETKKLSDGIYIQQRSSMSKEYPLVDSLLIVGNGNAATQRIMDDVMSLFMENLEKRGIKTSSVFVAYSDKRVDEASFNKRNYTYTLWIYEQDRKMQRLEEYTYMIPLAMKITDNRTDDNIWIATSVFNDFVRKKIYKERYANTLISLLKINGLIK